MTKEEAKAEFARRCEEAILPIKEAPMKFIKVEMPLDMMMRDMRDVLEPYKSEGWVLSVYHDGTAWWFASREKLKADVRAMLLSDQEELEDRQAQLRQQLEDLRREGDILLREHDARIDKINDGRLPFLTESPN